MLMVATAFAKNMDNIVFSNKSFVRQHLPHTWMGVIGSRKGSVEYIIM